MTTCKHFPQCGGCQMQDLDEAGQREKKTQYFLDMMARFEIVPEIAGYHLSPLQSRRRVSFTAKRTKKSVLIGFLEAKTHQLINIDECLVASPQILLMRPFIHNTVPKIASRSAMLKFHVTQCDNGFDVVVENAKPVTPEMRQFCAGLCRQYAIRRLIIGQEQVYLDEAPFIRIGEVDVALPPHPFLQATKHCETLLRKLAHDALESADNIADLFAGIGTFSYGLNMQLDAFEGSDELVAAMQITLNQNMLHNIHAHLRDLFRDPLRVGELAKYDAAIIDPPRAGAEAQCQLLAQSDVPKIAFISCEPKSFARDARILCDGGYKMGVVTLIDQFRFANHIEAFALFTKTP